jgi:nucleoside-diphosphate-sugar epimerase
MSSEASPFRNTNILVVGGAGFVGSNLVKQLLAQDPRRIIIVDNLLSSDMINVPDDTRVTMIPRSITDDDVLRDLPEDLDFAWHLACFHGNQSSIADPLMDHHNNALASLKLFNRLKDTRSLKKVIYSGAGCSAAEKTFGEPAATREDTPVSLHHDSPYSISKLVGELYGSYFFRHSGMPFVTARFQNVYGPGEILGAGRWRGTPHTVWRNVAPTFIFRALHGEALPLDNAGVASRDFIFVDDVVRGLVACAERGEPGEVYNLASGAETTILALAEMINEITDNEAPHDLRPGRAWDHSGRRFGDPTKSREKLNFDAQVGLREGLQKTVAWTRANLPTVKRCMAQHLRFVPEVKAYL